MIQRRSGHHRASNSRRARAAGIGILAILAGGYGVWTALDAEDAPRSSSPVIAFASPVGSVSPSAGYVIGSRVRVQRCGNPVEVEVVVATPREFWRRSADLPRVSVLSLGIRDATVRNVEATVVYLNGSPPVKSSTLLGRTARPFVGRALTAVSVRVPGWRRRHHALRVTFQADWIEDRGFKTCWLRLPELVGPRQEETSDGTSLLTNLRLPRKSRAEQIGGVSVGGSVGRREYDIRRVVTLPETAALGESIVRTTHEVLSDESKPAPARVRQAAWSCTAPRVGAPSEQSITFREPLPALRDYQAVSASDGSCAAAVAIAESGADLWTNLLLILAGGGLSLGMGLLVSLYVEGTTRTGRRKGPPDGASAPSPTARSHGKR